MDLQELNISTLKEMVKTVERSSKRIDTIIQPFMGDNLNRKQWIELYQVGKFISLLDVYSRITERRESPDFIISFNDEFIGLEHESIKDEKIASDFQSTSALFDDAAIEFSKRFPGINILANISLSVDRLVFKKHEKSVFIDTIVDFVSNYLSNQETPRPYFIGDINIMDHSMVSFNYNPIFHNINQLKEDRLLSAIKKKESKTTSYRENSNLEKQWLLLTIGTYYPDSFEFSDNPFQIEVISDFDRIYLMEDIHGYLWRIK